jgi:glycosyltransferase involved in cell wall biosynthesis
LTSKSQTFVISDLGSGGAQRVMVSIVNGMIDKGIRVTVITFNEKGSDFFQLSPLVSRRCIGGIEVSSGVTNAVISNIKRVLSLRRCLREIESDVVIGFVGTTNIVLILAAIGLELPVVISERNDPARQSLGKSWDILRWIFYRFANVVTANSNGALNTLSRFVPHKKLILVPNPVDILDETDLNNLNRCGNTVLAVGRLYPQKAFDILLRAFAIFHKKKSDWRLVILGDGPLYSELLELAEQLHISEYIEWKGLVETPLQYYLEADIFVIASRFEGMPNALLEAMSTALPSIVTDALEGALEVVGHDVNGLVVNVEDPNGLAEAMYQLAEDENLRLRLGEAARARVASEYSIENALFIWSQVVALACHNN